MSRTLPLALAFVTLAAPALADECSDFRAALAIKNAAFIAQHQYDEARRRSAAAQGKVPDIDFSDDAMALQAAIDRAVDAVNEAARAVREQIRGDAASATVDALLALRTAESVVTRAVFEWRRTIPITETENLHLVSIALAESAVAIDTAYHEALKAVCRLESNDLTQ